MVIVDIPILKSFGSTSGNVDSLSFKMASVLYFNREIPVLCDYAFACVVVAQFGWLWKNSVQFHSSDDISLFYLH